MLVPDGEGEEAAEAEKVAGVTGLEMVVMLLTMRGRRLVRQGRSQVYKWW